MPDTRNTSTLAQDIPFVNSSYLENILLPLYFKSKTSFDQLDTEDFVYLHKQLLNIRCLAERVFKVFENEDRTNTFHLRLNQEEILLAYFIMSELQTKKLISRYPQDNTLKNVLFYSQVFSPVHTPSISDLLSQILQDDQELHDSLTKKSNSR
jgi:hypothetical protein